MIDLTLILSSRAYERLTFEDFDRLVIGRSEECEIHVDNLAVSRQHAEIVNVQGVHVLRVVGKNQTFVNGAPVETHNLNDGDLISIGKFTIAYSNDDPWSGGGPAQGGGGALSAQTIVGADKGAQARQESFHHLPAYVVDQEGETTLLEQAFYLFGKWDRSDYPLKGLTTPRCAAILLREDTGYRLVDLSPKRNQVRLNDKPVHDARLGDEDLIVIGKHRLTFHLGKPGPDDD